jgi:hypothetical protein
MNKKGITYIHERCVRIDTYWNGILTVQTWAVEAPWKKLARKQLLPRVDRGFSSPLGKVPV